MKKVSVLYAKRKGAFNEVIGDPYGYPEPIEGHYTLLKNKSSTAIVEPNQKSPSPINQAKPNAIDFAVDVEAAVREGLVLFGHTDIRQIDHLLRMFYNTYITEIGEVFDQQERAQIEQTIGYIFLKNGISPVMRYFTTVKK